MFSGIFGGLFSILWTFSDILVITRWAFKQPSNSSFGWPTGTSPGPSSQRQIRGRWRASRFRVYSQGGAAAKFCLPGTRSQDSGRPSSLPSAQPERSSGGPSVPPHLPGTRETLRFQNCFLPPSAAIFPPPHSRPGRPCSLLARPPPPMPELWRPRTPASPNRRCSSAGGRAGEKDSLQHPRPSS